MGYTTHFTGGVTVTPPLNEHEIAYLQRFADSRRMHRTQGPYYANPRNEWGQSGTGILDFNEPPQPQPGLWCQWVPTEDGSAICWDGGEKFYDSAEWMAYLINTFLKPDSTVQRELRERSEAQDGALPTPQQAQQEWVYPPEFEHFTFDHIVNGEIDADGESSGDVWRLVVRDNVVSVQSGEISFAHETVIGDDPSSPITATVVDGFLDEQPDLDPGPLALPATSTP